LRSWAAIHLTSLDVAVAIFTMSVRLFRGDVLTFLGGGAFHQQHQES
jgi:hypothetical protein